MGSGPVFWGWNSEGGKGFKTVRDNFMGRDRVRFIISEDSRVTDAQKAK